mmetsp:Transcript_2251/g.4684  ORF Transcript_2251/g.4684 Transcript_2251/m.4684 type:complete len:365 (-) Transcript_2251:989-2083(-)
MCVRAYVQSLILKKNKKGQARPGQASHNPQRSSRVAPLLRAPVGPQCREGLLSVLFRDPGGFLRRVDRHRDVLEADAAHPCQGLPDLESPGPLEVADGPEDLLPQQRQRRRSCFLQLCHEAVHPAPVQHRIEEFQQLVQAGFGVVRGRLQYPSNAQSDSNQLFLSQQLLQPRRVDASFFLVVVVAVRVVAVVDDAIAAILVQHQSPPPLGEGHHHVRIEPARKGIGRSPELRRPRGFPFQPVDDAPARVLDVPVGKLAADRPRLCRGIRGDVFVQQHHVVGNVQPVADPADDDQGRNPVRVVQPVHPVEEGSDGLVHDECSHPTVPGHKVCRANVLVDQYRPRSQFDRFCHVGGLGGGSRRITG